jgi:[ribosomal protein S5]-alanine N-acetyltransferase
VTAIRAVGARVLVRSPTPGDGEALVALAERSRRFHAGLASPPRDRAAYAAFLERSRRDDFEAFLLVRREDGAPLGCITASQIFRHAFQGAYLGYWIGAPHAGQGYMREGLALVVTHAFRRMRLHRLEANIQPGNAASRSLVRGLGFRLEGYSPRYLKIGGRWRDHERWAILREEWLGAPSRDRRDLSLPDLPAHS